MHLCSQGKQGIKRLVCIIYNTDTDMICIHTTTDWIIFLALLLIFQPHSLQSKISRYGDKADDHPVFDSTIFDTLHRLLLIRRAEKNIFEKNCYPSKCVLCSCQILQETHQTSNTGLAADYFIKALAHQIFYISTCPVSAASRY